MKMRFDIKDEFKKDMRYLYTLRVYILVVIVIFLVSSVWGYVYTERTDEGKEMTKEFIKGMSKGTGSKMEMVTEIFKNNIYNNLLAIIGVGVITSIINGIAIGGIIQFVGRMHIGGGLGFILSILPHGILEFPLMFISMGIGLRLGCVVLKNILKEWNEDIVGEIKDEFKKGLFFYIKWIIPLTLVAALIEVYITPFVARWLMS